MNENRRVPKMGRCPRCGASVAFRWYSDGQPQPHQRKGGVYCEEPQQAAGKTER